MHCEKAVQWDHIGEQEMVERPDRRTTVLSQRSTDPGHAVTMATSTKIRLVRPADQNLVYDMTLFQPCQRLQVKEKLFVR